ncbi:hypothetical protein [Spirosoma litoris]
MNPKLKTFLLSLATFCSFLELLGVVALLMSLDSCTSFEKAKRKYATTLVDTTFTTVRVVVPSDSAVLRLVTDTTTVTHEIREGRTRIIYQRSPKTTVIKAECDSVVVVKEVPKYITKQVWGVDPAYQSKAERRLIIIWILVGLLIAGILLYIFMHRLLLSVSITKRVSGNGTTA